MFLVPENSEIGSWQPPQYRVDSGPFCRAISSCIRWKPRSMADQRGALTRHSEAICSWQPVVPQDSDPARLRESKARPVAVVARLGAKGRVGPSFTGCAP